MTAKLSVVVSVSDTNFFIEVLGFIEIFLKYFCLDIPNIGCQIEDVSDELFALSEEVWICRWTLRTRKRSKGRDNEKVLDSTPDPPEAPPVKFTLLLFMPLICNEGLFLIPKNDSLSDHFVSKDWVEKKNIQIFIPEKWVIQW